ncbi:MAG: Flp/Fap pilin component [Firmicutes bacterium]|nr:Flp/Fap pilin component [Bacillota bacterium]
MMPCHFRFLSKMKNENGQTMVEYGLILFFVSIAAVLMLTQIGGQVLGFLVKVAAAFL